MAKEVRSHLRPTEREVEVMREWFVASHEIITERFKNAPAHDLRWSWDLTRSAGNIRWKRGRRPVLRLSGIIFLNLLRTKGEQKFAVEMTQTMAHEYAHLICGREAGHGSAWRATMRVAGFPPRTKHPHPTLGEIIPKEWRDLVPLGAKVFYLADGQIYHGRVKRYSAKTVSITDGKNSYWRIPWARVGDAIGNANMLIELAEELAGENNDDLEPSPMPRMQDGHPGSHRVRDPRSLQQLWCQLVAERAGG